MERTSKHLLKLSDIISFYFLGNKEDAELEKELATIRKKYFGNEQTIMENRAYVNYYATHPIKLGEFGDSFFEKDQKESILEIKQLFITENNYFEHIITEYADFLSPELVNKIMSIQDYNEEIISNSCYEALNLERIRRRHEPTIGQVNAAKTTLIKSMEKILREMAFLNKMGLGY